MSCAPLWGSRTTSRRLHCTSDASTGSSSSAPLAFLTPSFADQILICAGLDTRCCCWWSCANLRRLSVGTAVDLWNFVEASSLGQIAEEVYSAGAPDGAEREDMLGNPSVRSQHTLFPQDSS